MATAKVAREPGALSRCKEVVGRSLLRCNPTRECVHRTASGRCSRRWRSFARVFAVASFTEGEAGSAFRSTQLCAPAPTSYYSRQAVVADAVGVERGGLRRLRRRDTCVVLQTSKSAERRRRHRVVDTTTTTLHATRRPTTPTTPQATDSKLCVGECGLLILDAPLLCFSLHL